METNIQTTILKQLLHDENFCRKALPHLKIDYFEGSEKYVFELILDFIIKYNKLPNKGTLKIELQNYDKGSKTEKAQCIPIIDAISIPDAIETNEQWALDVTERWCQDRALFIALMEALAIADDKKEGISRGSIPTILSQALGVSFSTNVGHDYVEQAEERFKFYHRKEERVPFDIELLNQITNGGVPKKTLNVIMGGVNVGKTLGLCHLSASYLSRGLNVLYITLEMAEERIAERIDANLFDIPLDDIGKMPKEAFDSALNRVKSKTNGKLIIKEFPTGAAHAGHFRALLSELKLKKKFIPDVIMIDYIGICCSSRVKTVGGVVNTNTLGKLIAEELRGLGIEFNVPIWTGTQANREGMNSSDPNMTDIADAITIAATADFMISIIETEQLEKLNQFMVKQLKNRYKQKTMNKRFVIGVDKPKMRFYDVESSGQNINGKEEADSVNTSLANNPFAKKNKKDFSKFKT